VSKPPAFPGVSMPLLLICASAMQIRHRRPLTASVTPTSATPVVGSRLARRIAVAGPFHCGTYTRLSLRASAPCLFHWYGVLNLAGLLLNVGRDVARPRRITKRQALERA
jgi:hypothetical protein